MAIPSPLDNTASRRVYYYTEEIAALLQQSGLGWQVVAAPVEFPCEDAHFAVLVADCRTEFPGDLRAAVERNLLRVIYVIDPNSTLAPHASQLSIFAFIQQPVPAQLLSELINAAFENLAAARRQAGSARDISCARAMKSVC